MASADVTLPPESLPALQTAIAALPGVSSCRITLGPENQVAEVHVLAERRSARQVMQDVAAVFQVQTGQAVDVDKISVAVLQPSPTRPRRPSRLELQSLAVTRSGDEVQVRVELSLETALYLGEAQGTRTDQGLLEAVVRATLQAAAEAMSRTGTTHFRLDEVHQEEVDRQPVVLIAFTQTGVHERALLGGAPQRRDPAEAAVRACLDALNGQLRQKAREVAAVTAEAATTAETTASLGR